MGTDTTASASSSASDPDPRPPLPELTQAVMDPALLGQYFEDLARCTEVLAILPKMAPQARALAEGGWTLSDARTGLLEAKVRGVQIRYRYDGAEWWDTLLCQPGGVRIVRMRQEE